MQVMPAFITGVQPPPSNIVTFTLAQVPSDWQRSRCGACVFGQRLGLLPVPFVCFPPCGMKKEVAWKNDR